MKSLGCSHESAVLEALKSGHWKDDTRSHLGSCAVCQEHVQIYNCMKELSSESLDQSQPNPSYQLTWLKAQFLEEQQSYKKALRPLQLLQTIMQIFFGLMFLMITIWQWPVIGIWITDFIDNFARIANEPNNASQVPVFIVGFSLLIVFTIFIGAVSLFDRSVRKQGS